MEEREKIILISCGYFEPEITERIKDDISSVFNYPVFYKHCTMDISSFYNPGRRQYDANKILTTISENSPQGYIKTVGLLRVDLFIPILTYIFGQASLNGNIAIASLYRLRNELYGLAIDNELLLERFSKVVVHELGHTFGLIHCHDPFCIMRSSTYVEDLDQKDKYLCHVCSEEMKNRSGSSKIPKSS